MNTDLTSSEEKWIEWLRQRRLSYGPLNHIDSLDTTADTKLAVGEHMVGVVRASQRRVDAVGTFFTALAALFWFSAGLYLLGKMVLWLKTAEWPSPSLLSLLEYGGFSRDDFTLPHLKGGTLIIHWFVGLESGSISSSSCPHSALL